MRSRTKPKTSDKPAGPRKTADRQAGAPRAAPISTTTPTTGSAVGVQSLGRAFAILEEVARHREGIGLAELSKLVGLHNSTTFHLAKTMVSLGYLRQEKDSKRYRVGRPLFALAASALDEIEMVNVATPMLEDLSRETGESGHFAVRMGDAVVVIARTSGPGAFQLTDRVGVVRPAHCTALGKIILASLRPDQLKRFLERVELKPSTEKSITDAVGAAARNRRDQAHRHCLRRRRIQSGSALRRGAGHGFYRPGRRRARHFRPDLAPVRPGAAKPRQDRAGRRQSAVRRIRRQGHAWRNLESLRPRQTACDAFGVDSGSPPPEISSNNKKTSLTFSHTRN